MFIVGYNTPGYMPEMEPYECEDADTAKRALISEMLDDAANADMGESYELACDLSNTAEDLNLTDVSCGYYVTICDPEREHDLGTSYWIDANPHNDPKFDRDYS